MYKSGICYCCQKKAPVESHHLHPLEYGGKQDGEQVNLCATDHSIAHREAEFYSKHGRFQELDYTIPYEEGDTYGFRIRRVIAMIIKAKAAFRSGEVDHEEQRRITQISWDSNEEPAMAHEVKRMMGFKSLERALKKLVFDKYMEMQR